MLIMDINRQMWHLLFSNHHLNQTIRSCWNCAKWKAEFIRIFDSSTIYSSKADMVVPHKASKRNCNFLTRIRFNTNYEILISFMRVLFGLKRCENVQPIRWGMQSVFYKLLFVLDVYLVKRCRLHFPLWTISWKCEFWAEFGKQSVMVTAAGSTNVGYDSMKVRRRTTPKSKWRRPLVGRLLRTNQKRYHSQC